MKKLWGHKDLLMQITLREVVGRYRGSMMGVAWSFFHPLLLLAVFTFVFGTVLPARWPSAESHADFVLNLFSGLIVYWVFSECMNRSPSLMLDNVNLVKKVVFPLELFPLSTLISALIHAMISFSILLLFYFFVHGIPHWTVLWMPLIWLPFLLLTLGFSWFLVSLGVFVRDVSQIVGVLTTAMLFLSPVFYPASALPEALRGWMFLNPLALVIEQTRGAALLGVSPDWTAWGIYLLVGWIVAYLGYTWFNKTRRGFSDVL